LDVLETCLCSARIDSAFPCTTELNVKDNVLWTEMAVNITVRVRKICHWSTPTAGVWCTTCDITRYTVTVEVPGLDKARRPLHSVDSTSDTVSAATERSRTGVNVSACLIIILQGVAVCTDSTQGASLMSASVIAATRRGMV